MALIKKKNFLNLGLSKRTRIWDEIRDEPALQKKVTVADVFGGVIGSVLRFSISAQGVAEFLIGDDPKSMKI